ncbi:MAG: phosphosulfolactate synthase [Bacteroidales bacterium]|jgi:phosphosulfolactate synthase|nr:phosphosulfolactate synthase [Bacteroidales bacterium]
MKSALTFLPERPAKPRKTGLTMVMDKGMSVREAEDFVSVGSECADFVKLGFGTSVITPALDRKIAVYKNAGLIPYFGGTLFEAYVVRNMFDSYRELVNRYGITMVEVSDGSYEFEHSRKLEYISRLAETVTVLSEVGSKKKDVVYSPLQWVDMMKSELEAGAFKVIAEARESGTVGIYNDDGSVNSNIIDAISHQVSLDNVLWEAPLKAQQVWFIKNFGANVNLGNIAPNEILSLETLRLGLRGDTFFQFLPKDIL